MPRSILLALALGPAYLVCGPVRLEAQVHWVDARTLTVEGQGWQDTAAPWDRLPERAKELVRDPVWRLSRHSAGVCVRFVTDTTEIRAEWTLTSSSLSMPHMPATGVSGLDLYARDDQGRWRWVANGRPSGQTTSAVLAGGLPAGTREYVIYLPLYNGVSELRVGVDGKAQLTPGPARPAQRSRPIVFYGTSITQGGCASRPGMVHTAILGRRFDQPVINLGFSGNGRMEPELGKLMQEIDAAAYVIDCLPNIQAADVTARTGPLVRALRSARPETPIVLVEDRNYTNSAFSAVKARRNSESQAALRTVYQELKGDGIDGLHYITGPDLLGDDGEATVDGSHPTDLGFLRQANAFERVLGPLLSHR